MARLVTIDDFSDIYFKFKQKGLAFLLNKLNPSGRMRTRNTFNQNAVRASEWYIVPAIKRRWNRLITGDDDREYEDYLTRDILAGRSGLRLLSLGSGVCSHELKLAAAGCFDEVVCVDIAQNPLNEAADKALSMHLECMRFVCADIYRFLSADARPESFDAVFFHASLHHFRNVYDLLQNRIPRILKPGGLLVINEYVGRNRMQHSAGQIRAINDALRLMPPDCRTCFGTSVVKRRFHGLGLWRMILADPSECVESENILPAIRQAYETVVERPYGGNILMGALKNIAHNFLDLDDGKAAVLQRLFTLEDSYLTTAESDFIFGVYRLRRPSGHGR
jgi:2-polyprenyl-3-methyl-5-hydroxy-6-metoxy-1,4-benzoquinol methylase